VRETYDKLVRDRIPDVIRENGNVPETERVSGEEYRERLWEKLDEELAEFRAEPSADELGDVSAVLDALREVENIEESAVREARERKAAERGEFADGVVLESVKSGSE